ncbi:MAG TPA: hypothetical protein GX736_06655 [Mogibacterium sp.]|nr:hypothetical protein [Mogibacterium sp.]
MLDLKQYEFSKKENSIFMLGMILAALSVSYIFYRNLLFSPIIMLFTKIIKQYLKELLIEKRRFEYLTQFKDFLFMISTAIGAGRSMKEAIKETIPGLQNIYGKESILSCELKKAYERMHKGGEIDTDVLLDMAILSGLEDVYDFVTVYSICKRTGASLITALNKAASVIIDKMTIDREIMQIVKRKSEEGGVIFIMPYLVILFLNLSAPDYIAPLYETFAGRIIMTVVFVSSIGIYGIIRKVIQVDI